MFVEKPPTRARSAPEELRQACGVLPCRRKAPEYRRGTSGAAFPLLILYYKHGAPTGADRIVFTLPPVGNTLMLYR